MITIVNFTVANNASWKRVFRATKNGAPFSLAGFKIWSQMRNVAAGKLGLELTTENGRFVIDSGDPSLYAMIVNPSDAHTVEADDYNYDVLLIAPNGDVLRPIKGVITVEGGTTKASSWSMTF